MFARFPTDTVLVAASCRHRVSTGCLKQLDIALFRAYVNQNTDISI